MQPDLKSSIAIFGPTASGKTKLGVAMAKTFLGEVVSVDSLQCLQSGGIVTAKPRAEEMQRVPHHMIDYLEADEELHDFARADEMLDMGLLDELTQLKHLQQTLLGDEPNFDRGIWKAIGYSEFYSYLQSDAGTDEHGVLKQNALTSMYVNTLRGGASSGNDPAHIEAAKALAHELHRYGMRLVYGGGTTGIMGAIAGTLVELSGPNAVHGIIPAALARYEEEVTKECADPSRFGTRTVVRDMHTRKRLMVKSVLDGAPGSGFVALSGVNGTMEELLEVTTWYQLGIHGRSVCIFNVSGSTTGSCTGSILRQGLADTLRDIPYLAGEITDQEHPKGSIALSERHASVDDLFRVRDLSAAADYKDLRAHNFSPSSLKGLDFSLEDLVSSGRWPVFRAVFLLMNGGSVLSVSVHHSTTDITGFGALLKIWASHCSSHSSQPIGFSVDWLDRRALLPSSYVAPDAAQINLPTLLHREVAGGVKKSGGHDDPDHLETLVFKLSGDALRGLKGKVTKHLDTNVVPWVSTSDVLYGLLWAAVTYAEDQEDLARRGISGRKTVRQMRLPVNVRSRLRPPLPKNYLGSAFVVALATVDDTDLIDIVMKDAEASIAALSRVATAIRTSILIIDNKAVEEVVGFLAAQDDLTGLKLGQQATDFSIVSWADESVYELDWGKEIGRCEA
ncbi:unnamed protein product [Clonostachys rhizophaga]|uniref:Uncharacterized protein n=1 Tax=Clonostachys rhizophaga TaxID=160324 RepID=A0A9N9YR25_9HYPO|nr:unnamed protein product [Clonostachys rhizophaga]